MQHRSNKGEAKVAICACSGGTERAREIGDDGIGCGVRIGPQVL